MKLFIISQVAVVGQWLNYLAATDLGLKNKTKRAIANSSSSSYYKKKTHETTNTCSSTLE